MGHHSLNRPLAHFSNSFEDRLCITFTVHRNAWYALFVILLFAGAALTISVFKGEPLSALPHLARECVRIAGVALFAVSVLGVLLLHALSMPGGRR